MKHTTSFQGAALFALTILLTACELSASRTGALPSAVSPARQTIVPPPTLIPSGGTPTTAGPSPTPTTSSLELTYIATHELPGGTHRPEILSTDSGDIYLVVVQPGDRPGVGQIKHRVYHFDANWNQIGEPFPVTWEDNEYGNSADHRAAIINGELVIVYQTLKLKEGLRPGGGGPAEQNASEQSLMLARYSLDGIELFRGPIVAHVTDFTQDNFPDHCLLWLGDRLLVSTGSNGMHLTLRAVDLNANVLAAHRIPISPATIPQNIGNSLLYDGRAVLMLSGGVMLNQLTDSLDGVAQTWPIDVGGLDATFPTGYLFYEGFLLVGHIGREPGGAPGPETNPYSPYLMVLDGNYNLISDISIGGLGFGHVHPTLARVEDRLFVAWSSQTQQGDRLMPQVMVEEFAISTTP